jgi:hypothetical protein
MLFPVLNRQVMQSKMRWNLIFLKELITTAKQVVFAYWNVAPQYILGKNEKFHEPESRCGCKE